MMMKAVKKQKRMVVENKRRLIYLSCSLIVFLLHTSCGFKQSLRHKLPKAAKMNYNIAYDTIIYRMRLDSIEGPFKVESAIQYIKSKDVELEVHARDKKFIIKMDTAYNVVKWSRYEELY
jgi:hypothetical protein